jgi:hypothetical protein
MSRRWICVAISFLSFIPFAHADRMVPTPGIERIALADAIIIGRVTAMEPVDIDVSNTPGSVAKTKHRVAVVSVTETILGKKETKTLRVGFVPLDEKATPRRYPPIHFRLALGQEGLMYLRKHPTENLYVGSMEYDFIAYQAVNLVAPAGALIYQDELKHTRHIVKLIQDPLAGLQAKEPTDRYVTAAHLVLRYRTPRIPQAKTEPISAEESRLILSAIVDQDWKRQMAPPSHWVTFTRLSLTERDGWKAPKQIKDISDLHNAVQAWYREHGKTYRIQRFVAEPVK